MSIQQELTSKDKAVEQLIDLKAYVSVMTLRHLGQDATLPINHRTQDDILNVVNHDLPIILDALSGLRGDDGRLPKSTGAHEEFAAEYAAFQRVLS